MVSVGEIFLANEMYFFMRSNWTGRRLAYAPPAVDLEYVGRQPLVLGWGRRVPQDEDKIES